MSENGNDKLAVLIDADNAQATICSQLLAEVSKFGRTSVKRAYGDWTTTRLKAGNRICTNTPYSQSSNLATQMEKTLLIHH